MSKTVKFEGQTYTVPDDASMDEIDDFIKGSSGNKAPEKPPEISTVGKIRNYLGTGDVNKQWDASNTEPHLPGPVSKIALGLSLADPAIALARNPGGVINLGKSLYEGVRAGFPKFAGGAALGAGTGAIEAATEGITGAPSWLRYAATVPGWRMMGQGIKEGAQAFGAKFSPAPMSGLLSDSTEIGGNLFRGGGPISGRPSTMGPTSGQYDVPGPVKPPVEVGGGHIPSSTVDLGRTESPPEFKANPGEISGSPSTTRFTPNQYNTPGKVSPPVEVGGAHIPDYKGTQISPEDFIRYTSEVEAAPKPLNSAKSEFMKGLWKTYKESQLSKVEAQNVTRPPIPTIVDIGPSLEKPPIITAPPEAPGAFLDMESKGLQIPQHSQAKDLVANNLAKFWKANGVTVDQIAAMTPEEQATFFMQQGKIHGISKQGTGYELTDPVTQERALKALSILESSGR